MSFNGFVTDDVGFVWVFVSGKFPGGIFSSKEKAVRWIEKHKLSGMLTAYPLDIGIYDWAIETKFFSPKREEQKSARFIGGFSSGEQEHYHYEDGLETGY